VIQPKPSQSLEFHFVSSKGVGCNGGEGFSSAGTPREPEGSKELSSFIVQTKPYFEVVEGGAGNELVGFGLLLVMPLAVKMDKDSSSSVSPRWVVERVKGYYKLVEVSYDQYEDKLLALFEEIEAKRVHPWADSLAMVTTISRVKGQREIKRLDCSTNYEKKGEQSNKRRGKRRGVSCVTKA
jgi:hypothetical protein